MYIFIDEHTIIPYNGEVLKRYVGKKLVKTIANPTNEQLKEFGYKELIEEQRPEDKLDYYIEEYYIDGKVITKKYRYIEIEPNTTESLN